MATGRSNDVVTLPGGWGSKPKPSTGGGGSGSGKKNTKKNTKWSQKGGYGSGGGSGSKGSGGKGGSGGGGSKTYVDGYNKAIKEANDRKSDDKPQLAALRKMLGKGGFDRARSIKLNNINRRLTQSSQMLLGNFAHSQRQLQGHRNDNLKAAGAATFLNLQNRARERGELMAQAATQGAGESDTLKVGMQALRNWQANQSDVNRSFYDTQRSINTELTDLGNQTRTARADLYNKANSDRSQVWGNYYDQRADAWTQFGNIRANPQSNAYLKGSKAFGNAAKEAGKSYKEPKLPKSVTAWTPSMKTAETRLNRPETVAGVADAGGLSPLTKKKPEGATLRKW